MLPLVRYSCGCVGFAPYDPVKGYIVVLKGCDSSDEFGSDFWLRKRQMDLNRISYEWLTQEESDALMIKLNTMFSYADRFATICTALNVNPLELK